MATVAIVGAGLMGTAVAWPLSDNGHQVRLVGTHLDADIIRICKEKHYHSRLKRELPAGVRPYFVEELAEAMDGADIIVSGVNSLGAHWIGPQIGPYLQPGQLIIAITKGLEVAPNGDLVILPDVLRSELPAAVRNQVRLAAVGGPCIAGELAARRQICVVFGCRDGDTAEKLAATFRTSYYHIWTTTDLVGLEVCAAFKNAYVLGVGLAGGALQKLGGTDEYGGSTWNMASGLFAQGTTEIARWMEILGGSLKFAYGLPGAGDQYVTAQGGRTVRLGNLLGAGHTYAEARQIMAGETLESAEIVRMMSVALPRLTERGVVRPDEFPLLRTLIDIVVHGQPVDVPFNRFFGGEGRLNSAIEA